jgi:indolepyruvate ferredoxin oxidoreductase, alpha subunit
VRGSCAVRVPRHGESREIDIEKCNQCGICLLVGCSAIQTNGKQPIIDMTMCTGCSVCQQICPKQAISPISQLKSEAKK